MADSPEDSKQKLKHLSTEDGSSSDTDPHGQYEITPESDALIPLNEWAGVDEIYKAKQASAPEYEVRLDEAGFIPAEEWSKCHEIYKDEAKSLLEKSQKKEETLILEKTEEINLSDMKSCPSCGSKMKSDALKCKYCGEIVDQPAMKKILL
jgi:tRNA(Ile2) C34 agmatinyltransferase TiaS